MIDDTYNLALGRFLASASTGAGGSQAVQRNDGAGAASFAEVLGKAQQSRTDTAATYKAHMNDRKHPINKVHAKFSHVLENLKQSKPANADDTDNGEDTTIWPKHLHLSTSSGALTGW